MSASEELQWANHDCKFDEVLIEEDDGPLKAGMRVLIPCGECGETPYDHMGVLEMEHQQASEAIKAVEPFRPLYHWSPSDRRKQIIRYGLRPSMRATQMSVRAPVICFADTPSWAWALSGALRPDIPHWDLWQTSLDRLESPTVLGSPDRSTGIWEVRTTHRVYKRHLWLVGHRSQ